MSKKSSMFKTGDGSVLEISRRHAQDEKALLALWPCTGGAFQMYRLPVESFLERGISLFQFNPPGHGKSGGQPDYRAAIGYFREYIDKNISPGLPLFMTGHSGGAGAVLAAASDSPAVKKFFLAAPVLDSRESLLYMYERGTIIEFNTLVAANSSDRHKVLKILSEKSWMDRRVWDKRELRPFLNSISKGFLIGDFLEKLFVEGFNAFDHLEKNSGRCSILLAAEDNWYSREKVKKAASDNGIELSVINEAKDHYFTGAWGTVWSLILQQIHSGDDN